MQTLDDYKAAVQAAFEAADADQYDAARLASALVADAMFNLKRIAEALESIAYAAQDMNGIMRNR